MAKLQKSKLNHKLKPKGCDKDNAKDKDCADDFTLQEGFEMHDHVVLLGFNEIGLEIAEFFRKSKVCQYWSGSFTSRIGLFCEVFNTICTGRGGAVRAAGPVSARPVPVLLPAWGGKCLQARHRRGYCLSGLFCSYITFLYSYARSPLTRVRNADGGVCSNVYSQYADPNNPDTWNHFELHHAKLVVSCHQARILKSQNTAKLLRR